MYFTKDISGDYAPIEATVVEFKPAAAENYQAGTFVKLGDVEVAEELLLLFETLHGISSMVKSDHIRI